MFEATKGSREQRIQRSLLKAARAAQRDWSAAHQDRKWSFGYAIGWSQSEGNFFRTLQKRDPPAARGLSRYASKPERSDHFISKKEPPSTKRIDLGNALADRSPTRGLRSPAGNAAGWDIPLDPPLGSLRDLREIKLARNRLTAIGGSLGGRCLRIETWRPETALPRDGTTIGGGQPTVLRRPPRGSAAALLALR